MRAALMDLLSDATGEDEWVSRAELKRAGIPAKYIGAISHDSRTIVRAEDAVVVADDWAREIETDISAEEQAVVDGTIIDRIPRFS